MTSLSPFLVAKCQSTCLFWLQNVNPHAVFDREMSIHMAGLLETDEHCDSSRRYDYRDPFQQPGYACYT